MKKQFHRMIKKPLEKHVKKMEILLMLTLDKKC